jgi:hypothetical protein
MLWLTWEGKRHVCNMAVFINPISVIIGSGSFDFEGVGDGAILVAECELHDVEAVTDGLLAERAEGELLDEELVESALEDAPAVGGLEEGLEVLEGGPLDAEVGDAQPRLEDSHLPVYSIFEQEGLIDPGNMLGDVGALLGFYDWL